MITEKIFFSYSRSDSVFVLKLAKDLRDAGADVWLDQLDIPPGSHWDKEIEKALNNANCMLAILSPKSMDSDNAMDEISYALEEKKRVIPVLLSITETPFRLRRLQRIDFTGDYDKGFKELLNTLHFTKAVHAPIAAELNIPNSDDLLIEQVRDDKKEKDLWKDACELNTILAYKDYLLKTKVEEHKGDARRYIKELEDKKKEEREHYEKHETADTTVEESKEKPASKNKKYLFIGSGLVVLAFTIWGVFQIAKKRELSNPDTKDRQAWAAALEKKDTTNYKAYLHEFPKGQYIMIAQQKIDSIRKIRIIILEDEQAWNTALTTNTIAAFQDYAYDYPNGKHIKEARDNMIILNNKQKSDQQIQQEEHAWNTAVKTGTIAAFQNYKKYYPNGKNIKEAQNNLTTLVNQHYLAQKNHEDEQAWSTAIDINKVAAFENYKTNYPNGRHIKDALDKITILQNQQKDERAWEMAAKSNTTAAFENYKTNYPNGKHIKEAQYNITSLENQQENEQAWNNAIKANTLETFQNYKTNYPNGKHIKEAQYQITTLENQQEDGQAWNRAEKTFTIPAFENYKTNYPNGKYIKEANDNITKLIIRQKSAEDNIAWKNAINANTIGAFQEYQNKFPNGKHFAEAAERISNLQPIPKQNIPGTWINNDINTKGITKLIISNNKMIRAFRKCLPRDCEWKEVALIDNGNNNFSAEYHLGLETALFKIHYMNNQLNVTEYSFFNDGRATQKHYYTFRILIRILYNRDANIK